jgi:superfamily II DNA or RNA helicase
LTAILEHTDLANPKILVCYPNIDIKTSWTDECAKIDFPFPIAFCTFRSLAKVKDEEWDYIIFDEAHLLGEENQLPIAGEIAMKNKHVIFASGTYTPTTLADLKIHSRLPQIVEYSTEEAIKDGIVLNFDVYIHYYKLDRYTQRVYGGKKKWVSTDTAECERLSKRVILTKGQAKALAAISRMRFINTNDSLAFAIRKWIDENPEKRFIMFTDNEDFGRKFKLPMFNSKSETDEVLRLFQRGDLDQLCLIKKGSAGVTYPNLRNILITSITSNGETLEQMVGRALLTDTEKADIHVFVSECDFQHKWLLSALENISEDRIFGLRKVKKSL